MRRILLLALALLPLSALAEGPYLDSYNRQLARDDEHRQLEQQQRELQNQRYDMEQMQRQQSYDPRVQGGGHINDPLAPTNSLYK